MNEITDKAQVSDTPPKNRLVIRIKLPPRGTPPAPAPPRMNRRALLLVALVVVIALLSWMGIRMFGSEPAAAPVAAKVAVEPVVPEARKLETPTSALSEVIPNASRGARETISGTIRVIARVTLDKAGNVVEATLYERGPSRYFARLAAEAARQWTFTPTSTEQQRTMFVTFYFKRSGTTGRASPAPPSP